MKENTKLLWVVVFLLGAICWNAWDIAYLQKDNELLSGRITILETKMQFVR